MTRHVRGLATWAFVGALVIVGAGLAMLATSAPQCCDADAYVNSAAMLRESGWSSDWLLLAHNYAYPVFLAALASLGLEGRVEVAVVQVALLYVAAFIFAFTVARRTRSSSAAAALTACVVCLLPAAAWSGYTLSEALATPVLFIVMALMIAAWFRWFSGHGWVAFALGLGVAAGLVWMVRPQLIWVPALLGMLVLGLSVVLLRTRSPRAILTPIVFLLGVLLVTIPQLTLDASPFKFELAQAQSTWSWVIYRFAGNLSDCGPVAMYFSPVAETTAEVDEASKLGYGISWKLAAIAAHLVTGWDGLPSPTYIRSLVDDRWVLVTGMSGLAIVAPFAATWVLWSRRSRILRQPELAVLAALVLMFMASQVVLGLSAAEFRFNVAGWLLAAACFAMLSALGWWTPRRMAVVVAIAFGISVIVFIAGQLTLRYSSYWITCTT